MINGTVHGYPTTKINRYKKGINRYIKGNMVLIIMYNSKRAGNKS